MAVVDSQGTQAFTIVDGEIVRFKCMKKIGFGQDSFGKIDITCLEAKSKKYKRGMRDPGEGAYEIIYDDENISHDRLIEIAEKGDELPWYIGSGHSADEPTIAAGGAVTLPTTRAWNEFDAYINPTAPNDIEVDSVLGYNFAVVRTSAVKRTKRVIAVVP